MLDHFECRLILQPHGILLLIVFNIHNNLVFIESFQQKTFSQIAKTVQCAYIIYVY